MQTALVNDNEARRRQSPDRQQLWWHPRPQFEADLCYGPQHRRSSPRENYLTPLGTRPELLLGADENALPQSAKAIAIRLGARAMQATS
jgi:hypothetical protein